MNFSDRFIQQFDSGATVFDQGSAGNHMYVVLAGCVEIRREQDGAPVTLATLGEGEIFGEMALVDSGIRMASAVAVAEGTRLVAIDQARFVYIVSQQPAFALSIMRVMAQRIQALGQPALAN